MTRVLLQMFFFFGIRENGPLMSVSGKRLRQVNGHPEVNGQMTLHKS